MHYTGTIWRPPYEADSLIIEATAGCTHRKCKFCTLYEDLPFKFRRTPLETMEADLLEAQTWFHDPLHKAEEHLFGLDETNASRIFLAGANPFGLRASSSGHCRACPPLFSSAKEHRLLLPRDRRDAKDR
ncbi:hypothetical protein [Raoultibacter massiliensis]|uniref:hypothetical protein n=1 Tax=Raoultibacter massiliensis TaxID=1852371 RepID=UPI001CA5BB92|nr:hypothetical protein [Raoultibacter massiliensis]